MPVQRRQITELEGQTIARVEYDEESGDAIRLVSTTGQVLLVAGLARLYDSDGFCFDTTELDKRD